MSTQELKEKYWSLYEYMANSKNTENMKTFGRVMTQMMEDMSFLQSDCQATSNLPECSRLRTSTFLWS